MELANLKAYHQRELEECRKRYMTPAAAAAAGSNQHVMQRKSGPGLHGVAPQAVHHQHQQQLAMQPADQVTHQHPYYHPAVYAYPPVYQDWRQFYALPEHADVYQLDGDEPDDDRDREWTSIGVALESSLDRVFHSLATIRTVWPERSTGTCLIRKSFSV
jgi:hypothetical protein